MNEEPTTREDELADLNRRVAVLERKAAKLERSLIALVEKTKVVEADNDQLRRALRMAGALISDENCVRGGPVEP